MEANPLAVGLDVSADSSHVGLLTAVTAICILAVTLATALRLYTRCFLLNMAGVDDLLAVASWVAVVVTGALYLAHTAHGLGSHVWELTSFPAFQTTLELFYAENIAYSLALMAIKMTLFTQYYRVVSQTRYRVPCLVVGILVTAWSFGMVLLCVFQCLPVEAAWNPSIKDKDCSGAAHGLMIAVGTIVTDFILLLLPLPVVWQLKMKTAQKLSVVAIFGIGAFSCIVSIFRVTLLQLDQDFTFSGATIACWTMGELAAGCICPSLMVLQPFVRSMAVGLSSLRRSRRRIDEPGGSGPSSRKSRAELPKNATGSEIELCSGDFPAAYDERHLAATAV